MQGRDRLTTREIVSKFLMQLLGAHRYIQMPFTDSLEYPLTYTTIQVFSFLGCPC
jgi:hypothetical protein